MKKIILYMLVFFVAISIMGVTPPQHSNRAVARTTDVIEHQIIICYNNDDDMETYSETVRNKYNLIQLEKAYMGSFEVVQFNDEITMDDLISQVKSEPGVQYAEPNQIFEASYVPNDTNHNSYQWNFFTYGKAFKGAASNNMTTPSNFGIQAEAAWNSFKPTNKNTGAIYPGEGVKVAILDTGIAYEDYIYRNGVTTITYKKAPDLAGTIFDTVNAKNFAVYPYTTHANDDHGHGTHVCGTIAETTDSVTPYGCSGIAYKATILPIKVLDKNGSGSTASIANGLYWAADRGVKVINMSLGGSMGDTTLYNAIKYAYARGIVIVCASGNNGSSLSYPAAYSTECVAVGATDFNGNRCSFSNYGSGLDIVAPGQYIVQQTLTSSASLSSFSFSSYAGTSMAAPHVAGVAALVWSLNPRFTSSQVIKAMTSTAKDRGTTGFDNYYGNGLLDAARAVKWTAQ